MLRTLVTFVLLALAALVAVVFAVQNPGRMTLELAVVRLDEVRIPVAFVVTFALGWLFGLACCAVTLARHGRERLRLRRALEGAERQVRGLRSLADDDAH